MSSDVRQALQRHQRVAPFRLQRLGALEQFLVAIEIERRQPRRAGERMAGIGVAVEQLDRVLGAVHERIVDRLPHDHAAHRHRARGDALGERDHVGDDAVALGGEGEAEPPEAGDDFVEDQQNAVFVADRAQFLQIALGRRQHAGRTRHRLDDDGGDGRGVVQADDPLERVGEMAAPFRLALGEGLMFAAVGGRQMVGSGQQGAEELAVVDHAADGNAAEADAVIAALAADQALPRAVAAHVVVGDRDFQRGVGGFRSRIGEEDMVEIARREFGDARGELECERMRELEGRREIQFGGLALDRGDDGGPIVAGVAAPERRGRVENLTPLGGVIVHVLRFGNQPRPLLERPVRRERQPERGQVIGNGARGGGGHRCSPRA